MSMRLILAAAAVLVAGPVFAQDPPAAAATPAPASDPAEAALEAKAEVFEQRMDAMGAEMEAAVAAGGDLDAIAARYQPDADAFATELQAFFDARIAATADAEEKAKLTSGAAASVPMIRGLPAMMRAQVQAAAAASRATPQ